jgi:hypothetical protein
VLIVVGTGDGVGSASGDVEVFSLARLCQFTEHILNGVGDAEAMVAVVGAAGKK